ncbi:hypothetical protein P2B11_21460, partial [Xanthomonas perforans]
ARVGLFDKPDDLLGAESALLHVRPLGFTDFIASAGTAQWGQVTNNTCRQIRGQHEAQQQSTRLKVGVTGLGDRLLAVSTLGGSDVGARPVKMSAS